MIGLVVVIAGGAAGAGVALMVSAAIPGTPRLDVALAQLHGFAGDEETGNRQATGLLRDIATALGLHRMNRDLELIGETPESLALRKVAFALLGLVFPPVLAMAMAAIGAPIPVVLPGVAGVALGALLFFAPDIDVRKRAAATRAEARRAVCVYLELVALERVADAGTAEALRRAADIGDGLAFAHLREALVRAQLAGQPSWQGLADLSARMGVPELDDVADIMRASGEDGAAVYATLRARAASLRGALLSEQAAAANAASEHMIVPVALLGVAFMGLLGYPAFARILFG